VTTPVSQLYAPMVTLSDTQLDQLAERIAANLRTAGVFPQLPRLVNAQEVADALSVSRDTVYAHRDRLGGRRIGDGPRGRLRFDLDYALAAWTSLSAAKSDEVNPPGQCVSPRRDQQRSSGVSLLPIHGDTNRVHSKRPR
jgi:hypothetical protein